MADAFRSWAVRGPGFDELLASVRFEEHGRGRRGTVLALADDDAVPLVRTTTQHKLPAQPFRNVHLRLAREIGGAFNNALIEHYTNAYSRMRPHSDQALDLADASWIAIYSSYRDPSRPSRRLTVKPKQQGDSFDIVLAQGNVVAFSLDTNRLHTHTIALSEAAPDNDWLGSTFRRSKTFVRFVDGAPVLADGAPLTLATEDERRTFFQLRRRENDETDFVYPALSYTISEGDLLAMDAPRP